MVDGKPPTSLAKKLGLTTSGVSPDGFNCPASKQGNECGECRACWDNTVDNINYKKHWKKKYTIELTDAEREILKNSLRGMYDGTLVKKIVLELLEQNIAE